MAALGLAVAGACSAPADRDLGAPPTTTGSDDRDSDVDRPDGGSDTSAPPLDGGPDTSATTPDGGRDAPGDEVCRDAPGWAATRQTAPDDCVPGPRDPEPPPVTEAELGDGDVQITLRWDSPADLDLHVTEPDGTEISFASPGPTATGGQLDIDANVECAPEGSVENVFWPTGEMPLGGYRIEVHGYEVAACGSGDYTLTVTLEGQLVLDESGTVDEGDHDEYEFVAA